jgi:transmembrane sensor
MMTNSSISSESRRILALMSDVEEGRATSHDLAALVTESPETLSEAALLILPQEAAKGFSEETRNNLRSMMTAPAFHAVPAVVPSVVSEAVPATVPAEASAAVPSESVAVPAVVPSARPQARRPAYRALAFAAVVIVAIGAFFALQSYRWQSFQTPVGKRSTAVLADGTKMILNTATRAEVKLSGSARQVRLLQGEIRFDVVSNPERPFIVEAGDVRVRTLGTQFDVYLTSEHTDVAVSEGAVAVSTVDSQRPNEPANETRLRQGLGLRIQGSKFAALPPAAFLNATRWQDGKIRFENEELGRIAQELNRYNVEPKIVVEDAAAAGRFSGVFVPERPQTFLMLVATNPAYVVVSEPGRATIRLNQGKERQ